MRLLSSRLVTATLFFAACSIEASAQAQSTTITVSNAVDPPGTSAAALGLTELTNDLSRQDLFADIRRADAAANPERTKEAEQYFDLYGPFRFPNDAEIDTVLHKPRENSLFGVDISHHTASAFPLDQLRRRKVAFVYMKATQGSNFIDSKFSSFWSQAGKLSNGNEVHRGAYHFLSSGDPKIPAATWGEMQAATFIKVVKANGGLRLTDMPPVVDLEWDKATKDGPDKWSNRTPDEIAAIVNSFLSKVKAELNRTPMIYTARAWWRERIGSETKFAAISDYPLWIADYSRTSRANEAPRTINGAHWMLWQFTESATMAIGFNGSFDANIFKGKEDEFFTSLGVARF